MGEKDANALSNIKSLFRSILITVQGGLTVQEFQRDYRDFVGTPIPYTDFGFQSLKPFLLSLKDTVQFFTSNGEERLRQVSTEDTKHIEVMVQRQKPSQKKRRSSGSRSRNFSSSNSRGGRGGGNFSRERRIVSKTHQSGLLGQLPLATWNPNTGQRIPPLHGYSAPSRYQNDVYAYPQPPRLSRSDQSNGRSITRSHGNGWKSPGYQSEIMQDQDKSQSSRSSERTSSHSQSQTRTQTQSGDNLQQNSRSKPCEQDQGEQKLSPRSDQSEGGSDSSSQGRRSTTYRGRGRGRVKGVERKPQWSEPEYKQQFAETKDHANSQQLSRYDSDNWEEEEKPKQRQGGVKMSQDICDISQDVQNKVKQVLVKAPRGLWANRLPVMYKTMFDQELPLRDQGYHSVIEFVSAMPHIVRVERPYEKGDWMLSDATQARKGGDEPLCKEEKLAVQMKMIPEKLPSAERTQELQESVLQVLQSHTDGVALHHFKEVYQEMTGLTLDYGEKDMNSLLVLLSHCGVLRMEYSGPNTSRLYAVPNSDVRRFDYLKDAYKPHSFETAFTELVERDDSLPSDAVGPGVFYKPAVISNLQQGTKDNSVYYEMHVSNVVSPGLFWLQRRENVTALDELMDALEAVYNQQGDLYRMPESMMVHGQVCVTLFPEDNNWHRAIITGGTHSMVQVYYVDYGNTCSVPASTIRFLKKKFLSMPVQAIQAKMAYLFPPPGQQTFTPESKQALLDMVIMKPLMALIADIQNRVLSVVLVDTNGDNDIFINDYLVTNGHAIFEKEVNAAETGGEEDIPTTELHPAYVEGQRFIRQLDCSPEIGFHVINLDGSLYVASAEVSALFWEDDILASMLQQSNVGVPIPKMVVNRKNCPAFFQELYCYGVHYLDKTTQMLSLYSLDCLPLLLDLYGDQSAVAEQVKEAILQHLKDFDSNDPFWKGGDDDSASVGACSEGTDTMEEEDQGDDGKLTMKELQLALNSMQFKRKRILRRMTVETECVAEDIQDLEDTEDSISKIQDLIQSMKDKQDSKVSPSAGNTAEKPSSSCTKTVAPLPKHQSSLSTSSNVAAIKTNIVAPMVKSPPSPPSSLPQEQTTPLSVQGESTLAGQGQCSLVAAPGGQASDDLEQIASKNRRLEEMIREQDKILNSMLGQGMGAMGMSLPASSSGCGGGGSQGMGAMGMSLPASSSGCGGGGSQGMGAMGMSLPASSSGCGGGGSQGMGAMGMSLPASSPGCGGGGSQGLGAMGMSLNAPGGMGSQTAVGMSLAAPSASVSGNVGSRGVGNLGMPLSTSSASAGATDGLGFQGFDMANLHNLLQQTTLQNPSTTGQPQLFQIPSLSQIFPSSSQAQVVQNQYQQQQSSGQLQPLPRQGQVAQNRYQLQESSNHPQPVSHPSQPPTVQYGGHYGFLNPAAAAFNPAGSLNPIGSLNPHLPSRFSLPPPPILGFMAPRMGSQQYINESAGPQPGLFQPSERSGASSLQQQLLARQLQHQQLLMRQQQLMAAPASQSAAMATLGGTATPHVSIPASYGPVTMTTTAGNPSFYPKGPTLQMNPLNTDVSQMNPSAAPFNPGHLLLPGIGDQGDNLGQGQTGVSQLLPGMLPLLQSLKANYVKTTTS